MKHKVLFVDDEPLVVEGLKRALYKEPYEMLCANSAEEAYGILEQEHVDVVVSDDQMPGVSGVDFLVAIRRKYPEVIRIMLTGRATIDTAIRAINKGEVYRFLSKPCDEVEVATTILQALRQRELVDETKKLLMMFNKQQTLINRLETTLPQIHGSELDEEEIMITDDLPSDMDMNKLIDEIKKHTRKSVD